MLLHPLKQGVEGSDVFEVSVGDHSLLFFSENPSGKYIFVLSLLMASTVDYQQIIVDM